LEDCKKIIYLWIIIYRFLFVGKFINFSYGTYEFYIQILPIDFIYEKNHRKLRTDPNP